MKVDWRSNMLAACCACAFFASVPSLFSTVSAAPSAYYDAVQKVYIGYYQRPADPSGLIYWAGELDRSGGSLDAIIEAFADSAESQALYGTINSGNIATVVNALYNALFGRDAEAGGRDYYVNGFNSGQFTAATIMLNVLHGAQNADLQAVNNKLTAANLFTRRIDPELDGNNFQATYMGDADAVAARSFLALYATSVRVPTAVEIAAYVLANIADWDDVLATQTSSRPIIACTAVAPPGVPVVDALTGQAPQPDPHKANPTRVVNVGPMTSDQFYPSGALTLSGRAHDPENGMIDFYWTWPEHLPVHERVPSDATVGESFVPNPPRDTTYVVYLTAYDATGLFDQCQWNITVGVSVAPKITVIADDLVIDFGRRDYWRRFFAEPPAVDALPVVGWDLAPSIAPPFPITTNPFGNLCAYVGPPQAQQTYLRTLPFGDEMDPIQYPEGMTCVYAIVGDANGDFLRAGFRIHTLFGRDTFYAAIPVPKASEGGAQIVLVDGAPWDAPKTVADVLPGGLAAGSILDKYEKIAAYNATLTYLANLGFLPVTGPLLTYTPILPLPIWPRGIGGGPQALPVIWEAPDDPDPANRFGYRAGTHDCVTHRDELDYDPLCTIPAGGALQIEGWVIDSPRNPIQSGFTAVAFPDWEFYLTPEAPNLISPNGTIDTHTPTYTWHAVSTATYYQLLVSDASGSWVIDRTYAASEAGCAAGTGTCSLAPDTPLARGNATWFVTAWNPAGWGPWSSAMDFVVNVATDPGVLGSVRFTTGAMGLDVVGTTTYVMLENSHLAIVDVAQPSQPVSTVLFDVKGHSSGRGVSVTSQQYAVIGAGSFKIVDVRAPRSPVVLATHGFNADCGRLTVRGEVAFVACGKLSYTTEGMLGIATLANPADGMVNRGIGSITYSTTVKDVELSADGTTAFLLGSSGAVAAYDVTNPAQPSATPKSSVLSTGVTTSYAIDREGTLLAVAAGRLELIDASNVSGLRRLGSDRYRDVRDVDLVGTTAYAVGAFGNAGKFWIYDVSNPASPRVTTDLDLADPATAVKVIGQRAFVTTRSSTGTGALLVIGF